MKYIVLKTKTRNGIVQKVPIIFPNFLVHQDVAKYLAGLLIKLHDREDNITVASAGEIDLGRVYCYGKSETCKVGSSPDDNEMIEMYKYLNGIET